MQSTVDLPQIPASWNHHHLLGLESLTKEELTLILDMAEALHAATQGGKHKLDLLRGRTMANLFFENSTRTRNSFSLAAKRLGADTVEFSAGTSSTAKGESFIDTAKTIEAMGVDAVVVRHATAGTPHLLARHLAAPSSTLAMVRMNTQRKGFWIFLPSDSSVDSLEGLTVPWWATLHIAERLDPISGA